MRGFELLIVLLLLILGKMGASVLLITVSLVPMLSFSLRLLEPQREYYQSAQKR